jgi:hypothetical protein
VSTTERENPVIDGLVLEIASRLERAEREDGTISRYVFATAGVTDEQMVEACRRIYYLLTFV